MVIAVDVAGSRLAAQYALSPKLNHVISSQQSLRPLPGDVPALKGGALNSLHREVAQWKVVTEHHITRTFTFPDFRKALGFVNRVGELAEQQGHHPDILLAWGKAEVTLWTHKIDGLTESDFIMAAKIDGVYSR
jgi:4a-hydroxytetrahydrobiopterin dehydratase